MHDGLAVENQSPTHLLYLSTITCTPSYHCIRWGKSGRPCWSRWINISMTNYKSPDYHTRSGYFLDFTCLNNKDNNVTHHLWGNTNGLSFQTMRNLYNLKSVMIWCNTLETNSWTVITYNELGKGHLRTGFQRDTISTVIKNQFGTSTSRSLGI